MSPAVGLRSRIPAPEPHHKSPASEPCQRGPAPGMYPLIPAAVPGPKIDVETVHVVEDTSKSDSVVEIKNQVVSFYHYSL